MKIGAVTLPLLGALVQPSATPALAQRIAHDSARQTWTLRSGPVIYRLAARDGHVTVDYFGPAAKEDSTTKVAPTYPRIAALDFAGSLGGQRIDTTSLRLTSHRVATLAAGVDELRLTLRHATLPVEIEERYAAWGETGVITRELTVTNRGTTSLAVDFAPAWLLPGGPYLLRTLYGTWGQERQLAVEPRGARSEAVRADAWALVEGLRAVALAPQRTRGRRVSRRAGVVGELGDAG